MVICYIYIKKYGGMIYVSFSGRDVTESQSR